MTENPVVDVLVIEDDKAEVEKIRECLDRNEDMKYIGATGKLKEGIEMTRALRPGLVILDLELDEGDGIYYLNARRAGELGYDPVVLVLTNSSSPYTLDAATDRGADRKFNKWREDYRADGPQLLVDYFREVAPNGIRHVKRSGKEELWDDIEYALMRLGGSVGTVTLSYLVEAIYIVSKRPAGPFILSKEIYPQVGKIYDSNPKTVQRGIKYCVEAMYNKVDHKELEAACPVVLSSRTNTPKIMQFIWCIANRFRNR